MMLSDSDDASKTPSPDEPSSVHGVPPQIPFTAAPPPIPAPSDFGNSPALHGRLHPLTLLFRAVQTIRGIIIPAVIFIALGNEKTVGILMLVLVVIPMTLAIIRYFTFTYRIEGGELITRQGLLGRSERHVPLSRVQDIRVEQGMLHRMFGMADVQVETAGAQGPEASLSVLSMHEAERLRATVFESVPHRRAQAADPLRTEQLIRELTTKELVLAGLTSNKLASVLAMVVLAERMANNLLSRERYEQLIGNAVSRVQSWAEGLSAPGAVEGAWITALVGIAALIVVGVVLSVVGSLLNFHGFKLSRIGEDLHREYGLLTRRSSSLPRGRIQVLQVEEKLLRRLFKLATIRADTAGSQAPNSRSGNVGRDLLLPIVPRGEIDGMLPVFFPDWHSDEASWRRVSRRAVYRGTMKGCALCSALTALCVWRQPDLWSLWPLIFTPFIYILNVLSYSRLGYELTDRYFQTRRGWFSRSSHIVPIGNTQCVVLRQTPFDRRHKVRTLLVDTAGQAYTGGGPQIDNVPEEEALELARTLARRAAQTRYRWGTDATSQA